MQQDAPQQRGATGLWTDLYQLTMMQAYLAEPFRETATFELFFRKLPAQRNYLVAAGLEEALRFLEAVRFDDQALSYLAEQPQFEDWFIDALADFRFTGEVWAVPEGTCVFPDEPVLQVRAPLPEAQLVESYLLNQIHLHSLIASKAARVVTAAEGRGLVDFGFRRAHGFDAGRALARSSYIAGIGATSNVVAGQEFGIPVSGTMAHSFVEAHKDELDAFRAFAEVFPESILLIDTYDTLEGAENVIRLARLGRAGGVGEAGPAEARRRGAGAGEDRRQRRAGRVQHRRAGARRGAHRRLRGGDASGREPGSAIPRLCLQAGGVRRGAADEALIGQGHPAGDEAGVPLLRRPGAGRARFDRPRG